MNILITSVGRRAYMVDYFISALNGKGMVHAGNSILTYALQKANSYILTPNIYDESYIDVLLDYCKLHDIKIIISLFDIDLPILARNKSIFIEQGITVLVSDQSIIEVFNDKWKTYQFIKENGFKSPATFVDLNKVKTAITEGQIGYPLIIKPRWGMGSIGIFEVNDELELELFYKKVKRTIQETYLKYESDQAIDESVIIQEKLIGEEWGLDVFNDLEGNYLACVPKQKVAMRAGETDIAITSKNPKLIEFGKNISEVTKHIGNLDLDVFLVTGEYYILEFNCRFGGQYPFSHIAGVNFPKVLIDLLQGNKIDEGDLEYREIKAFKDLEVREI